MSYTSFVYLQSPFYIAPDSLVDIVNDELYYDINYSDSCRQGYVSSYGIQYTDCDDGGKKSKCHSLKNTTCTCLFHHVNCNTGIIGTMEGGIEQSWQKCLKSEFKQDYFVTLTETVSGAYLNGPVYPPQQYLFNSLSLCPFSAVCVVILGQDPYHGPGQAHGLSFSVPDGVRPPPSLKNIYKEIKNDLGKEIPQSGNLEHWAKQGVLLLNATLTVEAGKPGSHQKLGWETFTDAIIKKVSDEKEHVVFLLWGNYARAKKALIDTDKHLVLEAPHPSPFSAHTGFFGSSHFSQTNKYLAEHNLPTVDW